MGTNKLISISLKRDGRISLLNGKFTIVWTHREIRNSLCHTHTYDKEILKTAYKYFAYESHTLNNDKYTWVFLNKQSTIGTQLIFLYQQKEMVNVLKIVFMAQSVRVFNRHTLSWLYHNKADEIMKTKSYFSQKFAKEDAGYLKKWSHPLTRQLWNNYYDNSHKGEIQDRWMLLINGSSSPNILQQKMDVSFGETFKALHRGAV